jgi:hypothetical protein
MNAALVDIFIPSFKESNRTRIFKEFTIVCLYAGLDHNDDVENE